MYQDLEFWLSGTDATPSPGSAQKSPPSATDTNNVGETVGKPISKAKVSAVDVVLTSEEEEITKEEEEVNF